MSKDFLEDKWTKEQSNSAMAFGLGAIAEIALVVSIAQSIPVLATILLALPGAVFVGYHAVRLYKRTFISNRHDDGGSSVK